MAEQSHAAEREAVRIEERLVHRARGRGGVPRSGQDVVRRVGGVGVTAEHERVGFLELGSLHPFTLRIDDVPAKVFSLSGGAVIVDHGEGYMTLYGYNETTLKSAGDWVAPGDVIATVGDSGGRSRSALYFELRKGAQPVDPRAWITRQPGNGGG